MRIIKMPSYLGALEKSSGLETGPDIIIKKLKPKIKVISLGIFEDIKSQHQENFRVLSKNIKKGDIFLGGDHSITYSIFKAYKKKYPNLSLVIFDCHSDLHVLFDFVSHQDWVYYLIQDKIISSEDIFIFGLRDVSKQEKQYILDNKIKTVNYSFYISNKIKKLSEFLDGKNEIYLSFDIDVISPKLAPGTGYIKKGGINLYQALSLIRFVKKKSNVIAYDLVEVNPTLDKKGKTVDVACRILNEIIKN